MSKNFSKHTMAEKGHLPFFALICTNGPGLHKIAQDGTKSNNVIRQLENSTIRQWETMSDE